MRFVVKICGVTRPEDAEYAAAQGANAIGLNFWRGSKRFVEDGQAREIMAAVPPPVLRIGVFVNAHPLVVTETLSDLGLDMVQLHGDEKVGSWGDIPSKRLVRAIRVNDESSMREALAWDPALFIYDAHTPSFGGGGVVAPWPIIAAGARRPFLLAGGLDPDNVRAAIEAVRPDGVDVSSGVESELGIKDRHLVAAFCSAALAAARDVGAEI